MTKKPDRKILENPFVSSLVVPIAIVLVGALIFLLGGLRVLELLEESGREG